MIKNFSGIMDMINKFEKQLSHLNAWNSQIFKLFPILFNVMSFYVHVFHDISSNDGKQV